MRVLVTGGAGFIGSNLCEYLVREHNLDVTSIDNYSTGTSKNHVKGVTYIDGDIQNIAQIINFSPDVVFHLGEYSRVEQSFGDIEKVFSTNQTGTFKLLNFCAMHQIKLVYCASSTKFSTSGNGASESPYAFTKSANVELIKNFAKWYGLRYVITYFYNAFGYREIQTGEYATLIGKYTNLSRLGEPLPIVKPGTQRRNFTHISDIIKGLYLAGMQGEGDGYGIGASESHSVLDVAKLFGGEITFLDPRAGNRSHGKLVTDKMHELGWVSEYRLVDYISELRKNLWQPAPWIE